MWSALPQWPYSITAAAAVALEKVPILASSAPICTGSTFSCNCQTSRTQDATRKSHSSNTSNMSNISFPGPLPGGGRSPESLLRLPSRAVGARARSAPGQGLTRARAHRGDRLLSRRRHRRLRSHHLRVPGAPRECLGSPARKAPIPRPPRHVRAAPTALLCALTLLTTQVCTCVIVRAHDHRLHAVPEVNQHMSHSPRPRALSQ